MRLKEIRIGKGLTQKGLSKASGVSVPMIALIEAGKTNSSIRILEKLAKALGCKVSDFFGEEL